MKYPLLALLALFLFPSGPRAQTKKTLRLVDTMTFSFPDCKTTILKLRDPQWNKHTGPAGFRHFEILDARQDTARIGVFGNGTNFSNQPKQIIFDKPATNEFADYLNSRFTDQKATSTVLVVIRFLWISDWIHNPHPIHTDHDIVHNANAMIRLKAEVYAEANGVYTPLFRFDSTQFSTTFSYGPGEKLAGMLNDLAGRAASETEQKQGSGRHISLEEIRHFNESRADQPILKDSTILAEGLYKDFEEFRNNEPSIRQGFKLVKGVRSLELRGEDGEIASSPDQVWGFCDGKTVYVMFERELVPTWKEGNAYYILVPEIIENYDGSPGVGEMLGMPPPILKRILTIDMDSGDIY
jgi:hypothetical protein